jgi:hypothetical protein
MVEAAAEAAFSQAHKPLPLVKILQLPLEQVAHQVRVTEQTVKL